MATITVNLSGTTPQRVTPALDALSKQTKINSLIIANTHNATIGVKVFLDTDGAGANPDYYILGGASASHRLATGYSIDVFEDTPFEIPSSTAIWVSLTANTASAICNYTTIDSF
tara:strand:- start:61 stop:405 length:345 start_codon:yes stop_codon:yes gene_type:complete